MHPPLGKDWFMQSTTNNTELLTLGIDGMSCGHCVQAVTAALARVPAVKVRSVAVGSAEIETTGSAAASDAIEALNHAGYAARVTGRKDGSTEPARAPRRLGGCCGGPKGCCG